MDVDYLALAILMGVFGAVGITATSNVSPNSFALTSCNCIPSPAARLQELSAMFLVFGLVLAPIALTRKGAGAVAGSPLGAKDASRGTGRGAPLMRSGALFALGIALVVLGVGLVAVPAFLVLGSPLLFAEGACMVVFGVFLAYLGGRQGKADEPPAGPGQANKQPHSISTNL